MGRPSAASDREIRIKRIMQHSFVSSATYTEDYTAGSVYGRRPFAAGVRQGIKKALRLWPEGCFGILDTWCVIEPRLTPHHRRT
jgi:hypothetical protein